MANEQLNQLLDDALTRHDETLAQFGGPAPVHLAEGGVPYVPTIGVKGAAREELDKIKSEYDTYNDQVNKFNELQNAYKAQVDAYNKSATDYNDSFYKNNGQMVFAEQKMKDIPYANIKLPDGYKYYTANDKGELADYTPTQDFSKAVYTATPESPGYFMVRSADIAAPGAVPVAPSDVAPTAPAVSQADYQAKADAAKKDAQLRQTAVNVAADPAAYGLSMNKLLAHGGVVHRAEGSPEEGEVSRETPLTEEEILAASRPAFLTPSSGRGRQAGAVSEALNTGTAYPAIARGVSETPYNLLGAPVDLATMAMRPFGYKEEKPMMGSEWIKEKMTALGVRPGPEANAALQGFRTMGELGASTVNPGPIAAKVGEKSGEAAAMLRRAITSNTEARAAAAQEARAARMAADDDARARAVLETQLARQTAQEARAVAPPVRQAPVQQELPLEPRAAASQPSAMPEVTPVAAPMEAPAVEKGMTKTPFVGRLDTFVEGLKGPVTKEQFLNQIKGKFRDYDNQRASEVLADLGPADKITPAQLSERLAANYSPSKLRLEIIEPTKENRGSFFLGMDNPFVEDKTKGMGVINLLEDTPKEQIEAHRKVKGLENALYNLKELKSTPEDVNLIKDYIQTAPNAVPNAKESLAKFKKAEKYINIAQEKAQEIRRVSSDFFTPATNPKWGDYVDEARQLNRENPGGNLDVFQYADQKVFQGATNWMKKNGMTAPPIDGLFTSRAKFRQDLEHALDPVMTEVHQANNKLTQFLKPEVDALKAHTEATGLYRGDPVHAPLTEQVGLHNPIAFSRFTEHKIPGPDGTEVKGIFLHELQSDRLDDIVKKGAAGGSRAKDLQEGESIQDRYKEMRALGENESNIVHQVREIARMGTSSPGAKSAKSKELYDKYPESKEMITEAFKLANREKDLQRRTYGGTYKVGESFAGMETNKGAMQQLMIKNAVAAAMQRGDEFVAFPVTKGPGASAQAQLYERLPFNAKQVIKDLGGEKMGFELRLMDLPMNNETNAQTVGLFWGKPAREHVMKTGVPFAKGGSVERKTSDNRRYL